MTAGFRVTKWSIIGQQGVQLLQKLVSVAIIFWGAQMVIEGSLTIGQPGMSPGCVIAASKLAGAPDFILELSQGYDIVVDEQGVNLSGTDFVPEFPLTEHRAAAIESRNALHLLNLEHCDFGIMPTKWQYSLHPEAYRHKLQIIHEGIDLEALRPDSNATLELSGGKVLRAGDPVVTYVARNLEPYRGFHQFMRALPKVLEQNPDCHVVVLGGDGVSYGSRPIDAGHWREKLIRENPMDLTRVHFLGRVDYHTYKKVLQISKVHVYLIYPFVLSWSLLEAMACGCHVIASDTEPVREVIIDRKNGELVNFFSPNRIAFVLSKVMQLDDNVTALRERALRIVGKYSSRNGILEYKNSISSALQIHPLLDIDRCENRYITKIKGRHGADDTRL